MTLSAALLGRLLLALAGTVTASVRRLRHVLLVVVVLSGWAFTDYGRGLRWPFVHAWEQAHFFVGSKYLEEIGYFDIYKAIFLADQDGPRRLKKVVETRDLHTFDVVDRQTGLADAEAVRDRFTDTRWRAFVADWWNLSHWHARWTDVMVDHGNSGSPAWALVALPFVHAFGSSANGQGMLGLLDMGLMATMFGLLAWSHGPRATAAGFVVWALAPFCFNYLAGSLLRWDWCFALGLGLVAWRIGRPATSGAFFGYAFVSKLFPVGHLLAAAIWLGDEAWRTRSLPARTRRFVVGAVASALVWVAASSAAFGGPSIWVGYAERIDVAMHEKYYPNQYSFETVYLQFAESTPREVSRGLFVPKVIKQGLRRVDPAAHTLGLTLARVGLTVLIGAAIRKSSFEEALAAGPFLVYTWLTVNAYYWNMLGLSAVLYASHAYARGDKVSVGLVGLGGLWAASAVYEGIGAGYAQGYFVGLLLGALSVVWSTFRLLRPAVASPG